MLVNHSQQWIAAVDGLSYIARLIYRFTEIEKLHLGDKGRADTMNLANETIKLYRSILQFQARAICQFDRRRSHQFARNLVEADGWGKQLEQIRSCEAECEKICVILQSNEHQQGMERLEKISKAITAEIQQRGDRLLEVSQEGKISECLATLRTVDYESDKSRIADPVPGTCQWFLAHDTYRCWLGENNSRLLWVTADPGCGKSVLSKLLVNSYIENATTEKTSVCYFFFRDGSENNQDGTNALCALLHQLFTQKRVLLRHALPDFDHNGKNLCVLFETLWGIFLNAVKDSEAGSIICVLDALDECGESTRVPLLKHIGGFFSTPPASATVKFIITSRPYRTIEDILWDAYPNVPFVRLMGESEREVSTIQKEILLVIDKKVERFRERRQHGGINDETHRDISKQLAQIENRTYLWVSLIFPELDKHVESSRGNLLQVINTIPSTVEEAYERILSFSTNLKKARTLLYLVVAAQRPLTLEEMNTALAVTDDCTSADDLELEPEPTFHRTVRNLCGLFITVSDSKIYLLHQTAREFLLAPESQNKPIPGSKNIWEHSMNLSTSNFELAKICLLYLHLSGLKSKPAIDVDDAASEVSPGDSARPSILNQAFQRRAFHDYSTMHWCFHVSKIDSEAADSLMSLMLSITTPSSPAFENWSMQWTNSYDVIWVAGVGVPNKKLLEMDQLSLAVSLEIRPLAKVLLKREVQTKKDQSIIDGAAVEAIRRCPDIFHIFLDKGLDLETKVNHRSSFLHIAALHRCVEVAKLLIEAGAAVNMEDEDLREPLYFAVGSRSKALIPLLLGKGARVNHRDKYGQTVLFMAFCGVIWMDGLEMAAYLIENGARSEVKDNSGRTPLSFAAQYGHLTIAELLIEHDAEIDTRDCNGRTPLSYATHVSRAPAEQRSLINLLINQGAQVDSRDRKGRTPLSYSAACQHYDDNEVVDPLIQKGAQIETRCKQMRTPLSYAAEHCSIPRLGRLIEDGAAVNSSDWKGNTPLMYAAQAKVHVKNTVTILEIRDTIKILLEKGANPNTVNEDGDSPLLTLDRLNSARFDSREAEAVKEETKSLLRRYGAGEPKLSTFSDTLGQVAAQMTVNLIEFVTNAVGIESRDREIAAKSSAQLFCGWDLHPTVSSITLHCNTTIQQEITNFMLAQAEKYQQGISNPEESRKKHPGPDPRPSGTPPPDESPQSQTPELELPKAQVLEKADDYAGLAPSERSEDCSDYLHRLAELQQRLFNVNRCLHYLDDHPNDSSQTIDDLIAKAIGQESGKDQEDAESLF